MKTQNIIIIALAIVIFYLLQCRKPQIKTETKEVRFIDTIFKTDTLVNYIYKEHKNLQPDVIIVDSLPKETILSDFSDTSIFFSTYVYKVKDSLLDATISAYSQTRPQIDFNYTLKNYTIHDTLLIKDSVFRQDIKNAFYIGAEISGNKTNFGFSPSLTFSHKKGVNYSLRYDVINKTIGIKLEKKLW